MSGIRTQTVARTMKENRAMSEETLKIEIVPALVSDRRCPAGNHRLGDQVFWCLTCNVYANALAAAEFRAEQRMGTSNSRA